MEDSTKNFFEKLTNFNSDDKDEFEPQLVRADISNSKNNNKMKKNSDKKESISFSSDEPEENEVNEFDDFEGQLTIDVYQTSNNIVVESTIAGVDPDDLDIAITPDSITIRGERRKEEKIKKEEYLYQECFWGRFSRSIILPQEIDPDKAQATVKGGILKIILPKLDRQKSKKLKVKFD
ncbi:MAG TPA: Hsp20/alpha crystallin family protein [Candidatus Wolfebacteria bacterium]|nr:Hsp20/alpha crystallin family protein [Candidatus Wolfebacteria bacterium]